jgi:hypothetical protein
MADNRPSNRPLVKGKGVPRTGRRPSRSLGAAVTGVPRPPAPVTDIVEEWGRHSFPASDPPANW